MSFGLGAGDVYSVTMLAWSLYRNCKNSGPEFHRVADDLKNLHIVLKDIDETVEHDSTGLSRTRSERLDQVRADTRSVLEQLTKELKAYGDLDTKTQKKWDALRWGMKDISDIKMRLLALTTNLNAFSAAITNAAHSRIEKILMKVLDEVQKGFHEGSILSDGSVDSINTKEAWQQLRKELEEAGIDAAVLNEKRTFIVELILRAKADGTIDEAELAEIEGGSEFDTDLSTTRTLIDEEWDERIRRISSAEESISGSSVQTRSANAQKRPKKRRLGSIFGKLMGNDMRLLEAADAGDMKSFMRLIEQKVNLQVTDKWDWTALHMAAYAGHDEMTKVLIEEGANLDARTVDNETPRDLAEIKGRVKVVRNIEEEEIRRANENSRVQLVQTSSTSS